MIAEYLKSPQYVSGIINPETGHIEFAASHDALLDGNFGMAKEEAQAKILELEQHIKDMKGLLNDGKTSSIGHFMSKDVAKPGTFMEPGEAKAFRGDVAKAKALEENANVIAESDAKIAEAETRLAEAREAFKSMGINPSADRISQGYVLVNRLPDGWSFSAITSDRMLDPIVMRAISEATSVCPIVLLIGGKSIKLAQGSPAEAVGAAIKQCASLRFRSVGASSMWRRRAVNGN